MTLKLSNVKKYLIAQFPSEKKLIAAVENLSKNFTTNREDITKYHSDEKLVSAYAAFYLTTNYPKLGKVLNYLGENKDLFSKCDIIDIGCGPGTFLFALHDYFDGKHEGDLWGVETSHLMRKQAGNFLEGLYPDAKITITDKVHKVTKSDRKRILLFTHSLNEMEDQVALDYISHIDPDYILFVEPGTKEFFQRFLGTREKLLKKGFNILYPCPSNAPCPLLGVDDWCHQYIKVDQDSEIDRLTQLASKNRKWLAQTLCFMSKEEATRDKEDNHAMVVRTYPPTKFSFEWDVCIKGEPDSQGDATHKLTHFQVMKRKMSKAYIKELVSILAGNEILFKIDKHMSDEVSRVNILSDD